MIKSTMLLSLFATATATGCAASYAPAPRARTPVTTTVVLRAVAAPSAEIAPVQTLVTDVPLLGPSGRPACGNVQTKSSSSMSKCEELASR